MSKLLFISPRVPWPLNTGAKIRTHSLLSALRQQYELHYAGFKQPDLTDADAREYLQGCASVRFFPEGSLSRLGKAWLGLRTLPRNQPATMAKYWHGGLAEHVRQWMNKNPDAVVHADHLHMAAYLRLGPARLKIMDEHNVETQIVQRMVERHPYGLVHQYLSLQAERMRQWETNMLPSADLVLAVSEGDARELTRMNGATRIEVIPNGVDLDYFSPGSDGRRPRPHQLVFTGSMDWIPNRDAMVYFVAEILPLIPKYSPVRQDWKLSIVGHKPPPAVQALASDRVLVTGSVPDVRPYINEASVYVVPLRVGGGSRLKILEAFAMGIPVVSTSVGCEGLGVEHENQLLIADTPEDFARAVVRIQDSPALQAALSERAHQHALNQFSWKAIGARLRSLCNQEIEKVSPQRARKL